MSPDTLFAIANYAVLPAWLLLLILPHHRMTALLVHAVWIPALLAVPYMWALFFGPPGPEGAGFGSLQGVMLLFQSPMAVLGGWIHYLAFDLFVGAWQVRDSRRLGINHWLVVPCLLATLMVGPVGLLLYAILRLVTRQRWSLDESAAAAPAS